MGNGLAQPQQTFGEPLSEKRVDFARYRRGAPELNTRFK
jgi:hypothetical protein